MRSIVLSIVINDNQSQVNRYRKTLFYYLLRLKLQIMSLYLTKSLNIPLGSSKQAVQKKLCKLMGIKPDSLLSFRLHKQSVDARNKADVHFVCSYVADVDTVPRNATPYSQPVNVTETAPSVSNKTSCVIVGSGPSGLFAALYLTRCGVDVTVIERGADIDERAQKVQAFFDCGDLDEHTNVQFGLGGAGTFSDGKLTTGISSPLTFTVFDEFVKHGAPQSILTDALPHIGTDKLKTVVASMRDSIMSNGGRFMFKTDVKGIIAENGVCKGVEISTNGKNEKLLADKVILACGHSARELFFALHGSGVQMQFKPFAVGLRIEHKREFINTAQYGKLFAAHRDLGSASYKLVNKCASGRGCYSFCMCPGGVVVAATSKTGAVVVNGMSDYARMADNSNSAIVVTVSAQDIAKAGFGQDAFSGVRFQQHLEQLAFKLGGGNFIAPCQNASDFVQNRLSSNFVIAPSYPRGVLSADLRRLFPESFADDIAESLVSFDRKIKGFVNGGVLCGVESRTSSPVKIVRNASFQSNIANLYPVGEGAGYAGGIVSAAVDGLKTAMAIIETLTDV